MTREKANQQIMAAAYAAAAALGTNEAVKLLEGAAGALRNDQWNNG